MRQTPASANRAALENELQGKIHIPRAALGYHRIARGDIGRLAQSAKLIAGARIIEGCQSKVRSIQNVVDFPANLEAESLIDLGILDERHIPLTQSWAP